MKAYWPEDTCFTTRAYGGSKVFNNKFFGSPFSDYTDFSNFIRDRQSSGWSNFASSILFQ